MQTVLIAQALTLLTNQLPIIAGKFPKLAKAIFALMPMLTALLAEWLKERSKDPDAVKTDELDAETEESEGSNCVASSPRLRLRVMTYGNCHDIWNNTLNLCGEDGRNRYFANAITDTSSKTICVYDGKKEVGTIREVLPKGIANKVMMKPKEYIVSAWEKEIGKVTVKGAGNKRKLQLESSELALVGDFDKVCRIACEIGDIALLNKSHIATVGNLLTVTSPFYETHAVLFVLALEAANAS